MPTWRLTDLSFAHAVSGEEEHGWNSPDAGKATAMIVIPGGGESGRLACVKKAEELDVFIQCHAQVREHVRVVAYDSRANKHEKLDKRKEANIIVLTMDCLRAEVQESMAVAEMNPGGYETAHLLQGAFAAFVPIGATSGDKSWLRIFSNLAVRLSPNIQCASLCDAVLFMRNSYLHVRP